MAQKLSGTTALVTGASSGIGAATAVRLAADGASVALVARRKHRPHGGLNGQTPYERLLQKTRTQPATDQRQQHN